MNDLEFLTYAVHQNGTPWTKGKDLSSPRILSLSLVQTLSFSIFIQIYELVGVREREEGEQIEKVPANCMKMAYWQRTDTASTCIEIWPGPFFW